MFVRICNPVDCCTECMTVDLYIWRHILNAAVANGWQPRRAEPGVTELETKRSVEPDETDLQEDSETQFQALYAPAQLINPTDTLEFATALEQEIHNLNKQVECLTEVIQVCREGKGLVIGFTDNSELEPSEESDLEVAAA